MDKSRKDELSPEWKKVVALGDRRRMIIEAMTMATKDDTDLYGGAMQDIGDEMDKTIAKALGPERGRAFLEQMRYLEDEQEAYEEDMGRVP